MSDKIMAIVALVTMIATVGVVAVFVPDKDLIAVIVLVSLLASYDFWDTFRGKRNGGG